MAWRNHKTKYYQLTRPIRIRLDDGSTLTNEEVTDQLLEENGWHWEEDPVLPIVEVEEYSTSTTATNTVNQI